ncbi:MAG: hypothetical protein K6G01_05135 [Eubacterium sp.]|nr:hypothetical protein [Eubacterium sp.]
MKFPVFTKECPNGALEIMITITDEMTDRNGRMRISDMARQMQLITQRHLESCVGITAEELLAMGKSWVISWTDIQIARLPLKDEKVILRIWPKKNKVTLYVRKYAMYSLQGDPIMTTASLFLLMDQSTRKVGLEPEQMKMPEPVLIENEPDVPKMMKPFPEEYRNCGYRRVKNQEIDFNGHLNNSYYLDWVQELMDEEYDRLHEKKRVWIQYTKEIREGQMVTMRYVWRDDVMYVKGEVEQETVFLLTIEY